MRSILISAILITLPIYAARAADLPTTDRQTAGMRLAATCANCHGTNGVPAGGEFGALAGMPKQTLITAMNDFRSGKRKATLMHQLAKGYSDRDVQLIAEYFAAQPKPPVISGKYRK